MSKNTKSLRDQSLDLLTVLVGVVVLAMVVVIVLYRYRFDGELAVSSVEWSNFGGYVGGVLGPIVSLVTLCAVLKTVYMQREILDAQREEFDKVSKLQCETFESQERQIKKAAEDALELKVAAAQDSSVKAIEMLISMQEKEYDRYIDMIFKFYNQFSEVLDGEANVDEAIREKRHAKLNSMALCRDRARAGVALLSKLALDIATGSFTSVQEVREKLKLEVAAVSVKLDEEYPSTPKSANSVT